MSPSLLNSVGCAHTDLCSSCHGALSWSREKAAVRVSPVSLLPTQSLSAAAVLFHGVVTHPLRALAPEGSV